MPEFQEPPLRGAVKYNPHLWDDEELRAIFVVRHRELDAALERIRTCPPGRVPQHLLITGYRGMGKTTLLRRIALAVAEDPDLAANWIPLTFPEEQYTVSTLAELWMNVLDALADHLERRGATPGELAKLDAKVRKIQALPLGEREDAALTLLRDWTARRQRRLLLLIDNSDLLLANLGQTKDRRGRTPDAGATSLWRLRKTLTHDPAIFWLGASYQALEADHQYQDAFLDFFEILELRPLSLDEMRRALLALAHAFGAGRNLRGEAAEQEMQRNLDARPERLQSLRALTGGNPRTTVILYELLAAGWEGDVHSDLKALLDLMTPLYKARMEQLAEQPRKLMALLMEHWDPIGAGDLAQAAGLPATTVSGQLNRLMAQGLVEKAPLAATSRSGYQAGERFFNIWYLMRYTPRRTRRRLTWLVEFMRLWFSADDLRHQARHSLERLRGARTEDRRLDYALALSDALPEDCEERYLLQGALNRPEGVEDTDREANGLYSKDASSWFKRGNLLRDRNRPEEAEAAYRKAIELGPEYAAPWNNLGIPLHDQNRPEEAEAAFRKAIALDPKLAQPWYNLGNLLHDQNRPEEAEAAFRKAIALDPKLAQPWYNLGILLSDDLNRSEEAEAAFRKAIALDPKLAQPWYNLGVLLSDQNRYEEAEAAYRKAIELAPKYAWPWYNLGVLLQDDLNRPEEAEVAYRKAIELDPKNAKPWNNLGVLLQDHLNRSEEAEAAYRKASALDPEDPYPLANLGRLLAICGDTPGADTAYRRAGPLAAKHAGDGMAIDDAGLILQSQLWLGNRDAAGQALERLGAAAAAGDNQALFRLQEQARECRAIGRGPALADLLEASPHAELLRPVALALRAADQGPRALDGVAAELRTMAEESLKDIRR